MFSGTMNATLLCALLALVSQGATATTPNCGSVVADIVFLLDSSGSVGTSNFRKQKNFVANFAQAFAIGPGGVQIGAVTFASTPRNAFHLNTFSTKQALVDAIHKIWYHSGGTRTDLALKYAEDISFTTAAGDRPGVENILIVMTDGMSNSASLTTAEAAIVHQMNIKVVAIGIGSSVNTHSAELGRIASDQQHVFLVPDFNALHTLQAELMKTICTGSHVHDVCNYGGHAYQAGETFRSFDGCNDCECNQGTVSCTTRSCI